MLHISDHSWNNSWGSFLSRQTIKVEAFFSMVTCLETTQHKNNQKTHANQLISDKFCSLSLHRANLRGWQNDSPKCVSNQALYMHYKYTLNSWGIAESLSHWPMGIFCARQAATTYLTYYKPVSVLAQTTLIFTYRRRRYSCYVRRTSRSVHLLS